MAKHNEIVNNFKATLSNFDLNNKEHKYLVSILLTTLSTFSELWIDTSQFSLLKVLKSC